MARIVLSIPMSSRLPEKDPRVKKLPIATYRLLSKVVCVVGAMAVASPLFVSDFRVTPDKLGDAFWDGLLAEGRLAEPARVSENSSKPSVELMLSNADLGQLGRHPGMVEMGSPYLEFMADDSAAGRTNS